MQDPSASRTPTLQSSCHRREPDRARQEEAARRRAREAAAAGKRFASFRDRLRYAEEQVRAFLKGRSRALALYPLEDWVLTRPHKVLLEAEQRLAGPLGGAGRDRERFAAYK